MIWKPPAARILHSVYPCYYDFCVKRATCLDKPSQIKIPFNKLHASSPHHLQCFAAIVAFLFPVFNFCTILGNRIWLWFPKVYFVSIRITYLLPARGALALVWAKEFLTMSEQQCRQQCRAIKKRLTSNSEEAFFIENAAGKETIRFRKIAIYSHLSKAVRRCPTVVQ